MMKATLYLSILLFAAISYSQEKTDKLPTYFGIQVKPVIPSNFLGGKTFSIAENGLESSITQRLGYSFGGIIRASVTKRIAVETGLNFTQRHFSLSVSVPDSSISAKDSLTFVEYDIPINALFYVQLSETIFMNASMGLTVSYKPTSAGSLVVLGKHEFDLFGNRKHKFNLGVNANFGFEYRTKKSGFFYVGGSARVPFAPLFEYVANYRYGANSTHVRLKTDGSFLSFDLKYFFPLIKNKGVQFLNGPIE